MSKSLKIPRGKHQNANKELARILKRLETFNGLKKIILGTAVNTKRSYAAGDLKFKSFTKTGLEYQIFTENGVRQVFLICNNKRSLKSQIEKEFSKEAKN